MIVWNIYCVLFKGKDVVVEESMEFLIRVIDA